MARPSQKPLRDRRTVLVRNRKARFDFEILETWTAGLALTGTEVKSIRHGNASLGESYVRFVDGEAWWVGGTVDEWPWGGPRNHDPKRRRKLLLNRHEIRRLESVVRERGFTVVPLEIFSNERGLLKMTIALVRGKRKHDKREAQREREARREIRREFD